MPSNISAYFTSRGDTANVPAMLMPLCIAQQLIAISQKMKGNSRSRVHSTQGVAIVKV